MYLALKLLHVVAVIVFLGNIFTGLFWHAHAARTRDPKLLAHTMDGIIRSDRWFTLPGVVAIIAAGVALAIYGHFPLLRTPWILWTLVLFAISGIVFSVRVAPMQRRAEGDGRERHARRLRLRTLSRPSTPLGSVGRDRAAHASRRSGIDGIEAELTPSAAPGSASRLSYPASPPTTRSHRTAERRASPPMLLPRPGERAIDSGPMKRNGPHRAHLTLCTSFPRCRECQRAGLRIAYARELSADCVPERTRLDLAGALVRGDRDALR